MRDAENSAMPPDTLGVFPITCSCGRTYSREAWTALQFDGIQSGYHEEKHCQVFDDMEMRRCLCGSTMSIFVKVLYKEPF